MKAQTKIFDRSNLKGLAPELQDEIIRRFNDYDTVMRVMALTAGTLVNIASYQNAIDRDDLLNLAKRLRAATHPEWLKENKHFY